VGDFNPFHARVRDGGDRKGGEDMIERYDAPVNIRWQTRDHAPNEYEHALADALQAIFEQEIYDLPEIVRELNARGPKAPDDAAWTEASFAAEMARLGA
jgi:hypothetical protein